MLHTMRQSLRHPVFIFITMLFLSLCSRTPRGIIVLCVGDSITAADYPRYLQRRFDQEGILAKVLNFGHSGYTSGEYLAFLRENAPRLSEKHPDFILIQLGTNDLREDLDFTSTAQFSENMAAIVEIFRGFETRSGKSPQCLIATIPPIPENFFFPFTESSRRRVRDEINPAIKELANTHGLVLVDNYTLLLNQPRLMPEVHPSKEGYREIAHNWYDSLKLLID